MLPEDAVAHGYNTVGGALDVSRVQVARYLQAAEFALDAVAGDPAGRRSHDPRFYARDQRSFARKMFFTEFNRPGAGHVPGPRHGGPAGRAGREGTDDRRGGRPEGPRAGGVGLVHGAYEPVEPKFDQFKAPASGRYKLRVQALTVWVGPNGAERDLKNPDQKDGRSGSSRTSTTSAPAGGRSR